MEKINKLVETGELTVLEAKLMNWLLKTGFYAEKYFSDVGVEDIAKGINIRVEQVKGVVGSLTKKGYLYTEEHEKHRLICATDKGYQLDDNYLDRWGDHLHI